jgi:urease accessory protein UreE
MKRVAGIKPANGWEADTAVDFIVLDAQDRHRRRVVFVGEHGATYLLDLIHVPLVQSQNVSFTPTVIRATKSSE